MKILKKALILTITVLMCLLTACGDNADGTKDSEDKNIILCADGVSDYQIVFSMTGERAMRKTAVALSERIKELTGVTIPYTNDTSAQKEKEILIGNTNRAQNTEQLGDREILITAIDSKIAVFGVSEDLIDAAVEMFAESLKQDGGAWSVEGLPSRKTIVDTDKHIELTVATYNLHEGGAHELGNNYSRSPDFTKIADDIFNNGADIIAFQEIDCNTNRNWGQDTLKIIAESLESRTGHKYYYAYGTATGGVYETNGAHVPAGEKWLCGVGIVSKYPIKEVKEHPMTVMNSKNNCVLLEAIIEVEGEEFAFYSSHNDQGTIKTQLGEIYAVAKKHTHYIVAGDFNWQTWPDFDDAFPGSTKANNAGNNIVTTKNGQMFDNIIFSAGIEGSNARAVDTGNSDHFLLLSDVVITFTLGE